MEIIKEYFLQNWALILILFAFLIMLFITVFLDKKTIVRMYVLIGVVFVLSIVVFTEFYLTKDNSLPLLRKIMVAVRYSATPIILALIIFALVKKARWYVLIPSFVLAVVNIVSIFVPIVFTLGETGSLERIIPLGYLPYAGVAVYGFVLVFILIRRSNKQAAEIIPIVFMAFCFLSGVILPFIYKSDYSKIFCTTIAIALFVYYVFQILQSTKKDSLTGLLNRHAYYSTIHNKRKGITAIVSIDMNGLKVINDTYGHVEGDQALETLALCFVKSAKAKHSIYRIGGDEFIIICYKTNEEELKQLIENIRKRVGDTKYSCSIGYSFDFSGNKDINEMLKESDEMMYLDKAAYYSKVTNNRRLTQ